MTKSAAEIYADFNFINSETPSAVKWMREYLTRKGFHIAKNASTKSDVIDSILLRIRSSGRADEELENLVESMQKAWRLKQHRLTSDKKPFSVTLPTAVKSKLEEMSKGRLKNQVLQEIIEGTYLDFLKIENERKAQEAENKRKEKQAREIQKLQKTLARADNPQPQLFEAEAEQQVIELKRHITNLHTHIALVYQEINKFEQNGQKQIELNNVQTETALP